MKKNKTTPATSPAPDQPQGQHTPGEWIVKGRGAINDPFWIESNIAPNVPIAEIMMPYGKHVSELKANAARIVHCVNNYDELKREHEYMVGQDQKKQTIIDELTKALWGCTDAFFGNEGSAELYDKMNAAINTLNKITQS